MSILYNIFFIVFLFFYLPYFILRGKYHKDLKMRLGFISKDIIDKIRGRDVIWLHAVSVGEVNSSKVIIKQLRETFKNKTLLISTVTKTGYRTAKAIIKDNEALIYLPLDLSFIVRKVIKLIKPKVFIIIETELWPNLIMELNKNKTPIILINGRISRSSFKGYRLVRPLIKPLLNKINLFCMQTEEDASKLKSLGTPPENIKVTGNTKFDITQEESLKDEIENFKELLRLKKDDKALVAGSTHYPEERILFFSYKKLLESCPDLKMIIAPRHIERAGSIEKEARKMNLDIVRYSKITQNAAFYKQEPKLIILDVMGKLKFAYALATLVFIGGSLTKKGGHNMIEPANFKKAVIFGPHVYNFRKIADEFLRNKAAYQVKDEKELIEKSLELISQVELREQLGDNAKRVIEESKGASKKNIDLIKDYLIS